MTDTRSMKDIEEVEECEHCDGAFDVSLPDSDEHRYVCENCDAVICYDCKHFQPDTGIDFCPDCVDEHGV